MGHQPTIATKMKKGFSLIELLVVLVLISIFTTFVGVNVAGSLSNMGLKTASRKVAASLRYARSRAVTEGTPYVALLDLNENRVTIRPELSSSGRENDFEASALEPAGNGIKRYALPENVTIKDTLAFDGSESDSRFFAVVFMPTGSSSGGTIFLENNRMHQSVIKIDFITGMVRLETS